MPGTPPISRFMLDNVSVCVGTCITFVCSWVLHECTSKHRYEFVMCQVLCTCAAGNAFDLIIIVKSLSTMNNVIST